MKRLCDGRSEPRGKVALVDTIRTSFPCHAHGIFVAELLCFLPILTFEALFTLGLYAPRALRPSCDRLREGAAFCKREAKGPLLKQRESFEQRREEMKVTGGELQTYSEKSRNSLVSKSPPYTTALRNPCIGTKSTCKMRAQNTVSPDRS